MVGVILNLAVWFGIQVLFPAAGTFNWFGVVIGAGAFFAIQWFDVGIVPVIAASALAGLVRHLVIS